MSDATSVNELHAFLEHYQTRDFRKGEIILFQGEEPRSAYIVKSGIVKVYNLSINGDEKPVSFNGPDSAIPGSWVYGKTASAIFYYEAFTPQLSLYVVPREDYVKFIYSSSKILKMELDHYISEQLGYSMRLNALQHSRASDKLLYTLHYLALGHGKPIGNKKIEIDLDLTHQDFANLTGLTRETAATELNKLKHTGVIDYGKKTPYQLDLGRLMVVLNDQYIADLKFKLK